MIDDTALFAQLTAMLAVAPATSIAPVPVLRVVARHEEHLPLAETSYRSIRNEPATGVIHIIGNIED